VVTKKFKSFRFDPELYARFKRLAQGSGLKVTEAVEKFMAASVANGAIVFPEPAAAAEAVEREARVMLAWMEQGRCWYHVGSEENEVSIPGRLLELLPLVKSAQLKREIEQVLKKKDRSRLL
jgi:hypothetical protein